LIKRKVIKKIINNKSNCNNNSRSQWNIKLIDNYYNIISAFDNKCLIYKNNKLDIDDCNKNSKYIFKNLLLLIIHYVQKLVMLIVYMIINFYHYL